MEHRHGLCVDLGIEPATGVAERIAAQRLLRRQERKRGRPRPLAADTGEPTRDCIRSLRTRRIQPHLAQVAHRVTSGLDRRTTRHPGYALSQRHRKRAEEILGRIKTIGGVRKTRFRGIARTQRSAYRVGAAYNLLRLSRLLPPPGRT